MFFRSIRYKFTVAILLSTIVILLVSGAVMVFFNVQDYRNNPPGELMTQAMFLRYMGIALGLLAVAIGITALMTLWLQAGITRPILSLISISRKVIDNKDFSLRVEKTTEDELGALADAFNGMLAEVEKSNQDLKNSQDDLKKQVRERQDAEIALRESEYRIMQLNEELEHRIAERTLQLETANKELEAFSYSVSHDLRAPLRAIDGFSQALLEDYQDGFDETGRDYLGRVRKGAQRMGKLIDDLLKLSRVSRTEMNYLEIDLSDMAEEILAEMSDAESRRSVDIRIAPGLTCWCDPHLMRIALHNLLDNAWKYSGKCEQARIEFGMRQQAGEAVFFVRDSGVGFDMAYAGKLFGAFQRLHDAREFPGTGIGLATVQRIVNRHGGRVWAESQVNHGSVFCFTLSISQVRNREKVPGEIYES